MINKDNRKIGDIWHLLNQLQVKVKDDHKYLGINKDDIGRITSIFDGQVSVKFPKRNGTVTFCADEIERLK